MKKPIKTIIFDLGGVIVNIDYTLTSKAFHTLGFDGFSDHFSFHAQMDVFDQYEMGLISTETFRQELTSRFNRTVPVEDFDRAWYKMVLDIPPERIDLLRKVKSNYRTFLLSNTNDLHIRDFNRYVQDTFGLKDLGDLFEKMYYSFEMHLRKPDVRIYTRILEEQNLDPEETLFIDDNPANVAGANVAGIRTFHMAGGWQLIDIFDTETGLLNGKY